VQPHLQIDDVARGRGQADLLDAFFAVQPKGSPPQAEILSPTSELLRLSVILLSAPIICGWLARP